MFQLPTLLQTHITLLYISDSDMTGGDKIRQILISMVMVVILIIPSLDFFYPVIPKQENSENRNMMEFPNTDSISIFSLPDAIDSFYMDNFSVRNQLLALNSNIKFKVFNVPPVRGEAFIGKNGWMFLVKKELDHYLGENIADDKDLVSYYNIFSYRSNYLSELGCRYYLVIAPIKTSVYPEYLPASKTKNVEYTLSDQIISITDTMENIRVIDLRKSLMEAKHRGRSYHITDNHWNEYGAYVASQAILKAIKNDFPEIDILNESDFELASFLNEGMPLSKMMGIYSGSVENYITFRQIRNIKSKPGEKAKYPVYSWFPYKDDFEVVFETDNDSLPSMLVIRESFGKYVMPYLSESFSKSVYIFDGWRHALNKEIVGNEKPDIFIQLVNEAYLPNILKNAEPDSFRKENTMSRNSTQDKMHP